MIIRTGEEMIEAVNKRLYVLIEEPAGKYQLVCSNTCVARGPTRRRTSSIEIDEYDSFWMGEQAGFIIDSPSQRQWEAKERMLTAMRRCAGGV
jgi:hypothetical protein